jgi:hypothetical protein
MRGSTNMYKLAYWKQYNTIQYISFHVKNNDTNATTCENKYYAMQHIYKNMQISSGMMRWLMQQYDNTTQNK